MADGDRVLSLREAAAVLGISPEAVRQRIRRGTLPATKVDSPSGGQWLIPASAVHPPGVQPQQPPLTNLGTVGVPQRAEPASAPAIPPERLTELVAEAVAPIVAAAAERERELARQVGRLEAELAYVRDELATRDALQGRQDALGEAKPEGVDIHTPTPVRSSWWRRLLGLS